jgi:endoglucanase
MTPTRRHRFDFTVCLCLAAALATAARADESRIRLNTFGFLPDAPKRASVAAECSGFRVVCDANGGEALAGKAAPAVKDGETGESIAVLDFSALAAPGVYRLDVPGVGRSAPFKVGADVYNEPFRTATRAMYLWRCGTAVSGTHDGQTFAHGPCHLDDAFLDFVGGGHVKKDLAGGWHDAGDYNKYVVNAGFTVGVMLQAWDHFGDRVRALRLDIPESGNKTPDFLDEVRWELDWLLRMQADDGGVYHKVSTQKFGGFVLPEAEKADRYATPWSSAATADFVAVMAMASRHFAPYDRVFAERCLTAARKSHAFLAAHPENHPADLAGFSTGPYQANDASRRLWMAVELWEATGEGPILKDFETRAKALDRKVDLTAGWGNVKNLAMYTYALSRRSGRDAALLDSVRSSLIGTADAVVKTRDAHAYARPLGNRYYWGCNGDVAQQVQTLHVANMLRPSRAYVATSLDAIGYLLGRNPYGRSFVTGVGANPPTHPHDRRSGADAVEAPWPGHLVGGPWPKPTDWHDTQDDYRTNEIAINWNATLVYALAAHIAVEGRN